jgi:hypothetical protein
MRGGGGRGGGRHGSGVDLLGSDVADEVLFLLREFAIEISRFLPLAVGLVAFHIIGISRRIRR